MYFLEMMGLHFKTEYLIMKRPGTDLYLQPHHALRVGTEGLKRVTLARYLGLLEATEDTTQM